MAPPRYSFLSDSSTDPFPDPFAEIIGGDDQYGGIFYKAPGVVPEPQATEESPGFLKSKLLPFLGDVGSVVATPARGLGLLATGAAEQLFRVPEAERRSLTLAPGAAPPVPGVTAPQPGAAGPLDDLLRSTTAAPSLPELGIERVKGLGAGIGRAASTGRLEDIGKAALNVAMLPTGGLMLGPTPKQMGVSEFAPEVEKTFAKGHPLATRAEAVAQPLGELGLQFLEDPALGLLGPLGEAGKGGRAAEALIGASFVPSMAQGAIEGAGRTREVAREHGILSPEALRSGTQTAADAILAGFGIYHAGKALGGGPGPRTVLGEVLPEIGAERIPEGRRLGDGGGADVVDAMVRDLPPELPPIGGSEAAYGPGGPRGPERAPAEEPVDAEIIREGFPAVAAAPERPELPDTAEFYRQREREAAAEEARQGENLAAGVEELFAPEGTALEAPRLGDTVTPESIGMRPFDDVVAENVARQMRQRADNVLRTRIEDALQRGVNPTVKGLVDDLKISPSRARKALEKMQAAGALDLPPEAVAVEPEPSGAPEAGVLLPDGERSLPTVHGKLFDATNPGTPRPELESQQAELLAQDPEAAAVFADAARAAEALGEKRTAAQEKRAVRQASKREASRAEAARVLGAEVPVSGSTHEPVITPQGPPPDSAATEPTGTAVASETPEAAPVPEEIRPATEAVEEPTVAAEVPRETAAIEPAKRGRLAEPPKDERGNPILPGQEDWTPARREAVRAAAEDHLDRIVGSAERREDTFAEGEGSDWQAAHDELGRYEKRGTLEKGTLSVQKEGPLKGLGTPDEIAAALKKDKGNALELRVLDAVSSDPLAADYERKIEEDAAPSDSVAPAEDEGDVGFDFALSSPEAPAPRAKAPTQESLFTPAEMLQPTEAKVTEGREAEGPLFTQEQDAAAKADAGKQGRFFDGEAALNRLKAKSEGSAFDLGRAAAEGAAHWRDAVIYGASKIEDLLRSVGSVPDFASWARAVSGGLKGIASGVKETLMRLWSEAKAMFQSRKARPAERASPKAAPKETPKASVPFTITGAHRAKLRERGYTDPQIDRLRPSDAQAILEGRVPPGAKVPQGAAPKLRDQILEAWKAGLVSGVGTQGANIAGNVGEQAVRVGETFTAGLVDRILGGERQRGSGEARAEMAGGLKGAREGLGKLGQELGDILKLKPEKLDHARPAEYQSGAIPGKGGRFVRIPFRVLSAFDGFFKEVGGAAELAKLAQRKAKADLGAQATADAVRTRADAIESEARAGGHKDINAKVEQARRDRTFQDDPPKIIKNLLEMRNEHPWIHVVLPFLTTPGNIARLTLERSPFGFIKAERAKAAWKAAIARGAPAATIADLRSATVDAYARPLLGTALLGAFGLIAKSGGMTGGGPVDPKDKNALLDSGWQPYSFVVTGADGKKTYIPFNRFEPVSTMLGAAADISETFSKKTSEEMFNQAIGPMISNLLSKTFLQGLADAAAVVHDPKRAVASYVTSLAGSAVPTILSKAAQAIDPVIRDTAGKDPGLLGFAEKVGNTVKSRIPGLSSTLPAKSSSGGTPAERPGNAASRFLSPVQVSSDKNNARLARLLVDLDAVPTVASRDFTIPHSNGKKVRLEDAELEILHEGNRKAAARVQSWLDSGALNGLDDESKQRRIKREFERARDAQKHRLMALPDLRARMTKILRESRGGT